MTAWQAATWADAPRTGVPLNAAASSSPLTLPASGRRLLLAGVILRARTEPRVGIAWTL